LDGIDVKSPAPNGLNHLFLKHQMLDIGGRDDHALISFQTSRIADVKESVDLLVDTPDGLYLPVLVYRTGHGKGLFEG
jgi:hypothetical protein